jgi:hypothetical protein
VRLAGADRRGQYTAADCGSLAVGGLDWLDAVLPPGTVARILFLLCGAIGLATLLLYKGLPHMEAASSQSAAGSAHLRAALRLGA